MALREYRSPEAFRMAVEQRIRSSVPGAEINRFRQLLVFDRFLARIFRHFAESVILKGGLVLELRLARARTTKDVDLRLVGDGHELLAKLRVAGSLDLGDWLTFAIERDADMPEIAGQGMVYDGYRFALRQASEASSTVIPLASTSASLTFSQPSPISSRAAASSSSQESSRLRFGSTRATPISQRSYTLTRCLATAPTRA